MGACGFALRVCLRAPFVKGARSYRTGLVHVLALGAVWSFAVALSAMCCAGVAIVAFEVCCTVFAASV